MDRFIDIVSVIMESIYLHISVMSTEEYFVFYIVPVVLLGIFIITVVMRTAVRMVHI